MLLLNQNNKTSLSKKTSFSSDSWPFESNYLPLIVPRLERRDSSKLFLHSRIHIHFSTTGKIEVSALKKWTENGDGHTCLGKVSVSWAVCFISWWHNSPGSVLRSPASTERWAAPDVRSTNWAVSNACTTRWARYSSSSVLYWAWSCNITLAFMSLLTFVTNQQNFT